MLRTRCTTFLTTSNLLGDVIINSRVDGRSYGKDKTKSLTNSFVSLKKLTRVDYLISNTKKAFIFL